MTEEKPKAIELDNVLYVTGHKGRYQIIQSIFCLLPCFSCAYPILSIVFIGYVPNHRCAPLTNFTNLDQHGLNWSDIVEIKTEQCSLKVVTNDTGSAEETILPCLNGFEYDVDRDTTIVSEWDLVCDRGGLAEMSQTMLMLGQGFGACIFTSLADRFGRRPVNIVTQLGLIAFSLGLAFVKDIITFTAFRFIIGVCQQGLSLSSYSILVEMCTVDIRTYAGFSGGLFWTLACVSLAPIGYLLQDYSWRYVQIVTLGGLLYGLLVYWCLDESLRWLVANNKIPEAEVVIKRMCKINKTDYKKAKQVLHEQILSDESNNEEEKMLIDEDGDEKKKMLIKEMEEKNGGAPETNGKLKDTEGNSLEPVKYTILDIVKNCDVLKITLILSFIWSVNSLTYYGLFLTSSSMSGNRFLSYFLNALVELPAMFIVFFSLKRIGRRTVSIILLSVSGVALITSVALLATTEENSIGSIFSMICSLIGKCAISASFNCLFVFTPELFPTNMRNAGMGVASAVARVGGMLSPYSSTLSQLVVWGPGVVFGTGCILASMLLLLIPETRGRELPTTIAEMNAWKVTKAKPEDVLTCDKVKERK